MEFTVYSVGLCFASVCTSLPLKEATRRLNVEHPTGTRNEWKPSEDATFHSGEPNPCPCNTNPGTHKHYLFVC